MFIFLIVFLIFYGVEERVRKNKFLFYGKIFDDEFFIGEINFRWFLFYLYVYYVESRIREI